MPRSVSDRLRAERAEGMVRDLATLLVGAKIGPLRAGYPGADLVGWCRLEAAREKAVAFVAGLDNGEIET